MHSSRGARQRKSKFNLKRDNGKSTHNDAPDHPNWKEYQQKIYFFGNLRREIKTNDYLK